MLDIYSVFAIVEYSANNAKRWDVTWKLQLEALMQNFR